MHCELLVPGLLRVPGSVRVPSLEMLLARGRVTRGEAQRMEAWLQEAFGMASLPAGALTALATSAAPVEGLWMRADPAHLRLLRDRAIVVPGEALGISAAEADALAGALNAHFAGRMEIRCAAPARWSARVVEHFEAARHPALEAAGSAAAPARQGDALLTEVQMVLHEHTVNEAREARGEAPINSLWLWGSGAAPAGGIPADARWQSLTTDDPLVQGLARFAQLRHRGASPAAAWLERGPEEGRHLVVLDVLRPFVALSDAAGAVSALEALEREWFAPLLAALRAGDIGMVTLHAPDGGRALSVEAVRGDLRRIWRRPRRLAAWIG